MLFDELTPDQRRAATAPGSVAVTAGAGTGKTKMLAARYLFHVREQGMSPLEAVAVTFTKKAAAELRSRIRAALLAEGVDETVVAEVDAAQISTVHSLAQRICTEFYHVADLPPDFTILDDAESPMWLAGEYNAALADIDQAIIDDLGFEFLKKSLWQLLNDPHGARSAFAAGTGHWEEMVRSFVEEEKAALIASEEWQDALSVCNRFQGTADDKLEERRRNILAAMADFSNGGDITHLAEAFKGFSRKHGVQGKWLNGGIDEVRNAVGDVKDKALTKESIKIFSLEFGDNDRELIRRVVLLEQAYRQVSERIRAVKRREKVLDFNDLEINAVKILSDPAGEAVRHYSQRWKAILVDEFQDTNPVQAELLELLGAGAVQTIVGDEKQAIYGFRGADVNVFQRYRENISAQDDNGDVRLSQTFRTHAPLVRTMNGIFDDLLGELHQELYSEINEPEGFGGEYVYVGIVPNGTDKDKRNKPERNRIEAFDIAAKIHEIVSGDAMIYDRAAGTMRPVEFRDIAILSRTWKTLENISDVLNNAGIPNVNVGGGNLLETMEARDIISLLGFLAEPADDIHLAAVLRSPFFAVSDEELFDIAVTMSKEETWWQALERAAGRAANAREILKELLETKSLSACETLALADRLTGYSAVAANLPDGERRLADRNAMMALLRSLDEQGRGDIFAAVRHLRLLEEAEVEVPRPPLDVGQAVTLMTIHGSKGLEWPIVFIPDLSRKLGGHTNALLVDRDAGVSFKLETDDMDPLEPAVHTVLKHRSDDRETAENRRLLYVGLTRARDKAFLTSAEEKGGLLNLVMPGVLNAGIDPVNIDPDVSDSVSADKSLPLTERVLRQEQTARVPLGLRSIPATGLSVYKRCPVEFKRRFVDRNPGIRGGSAIRGAVGTLTHKALELDIRDIEAFRCHDEGRPEEQLAEALRFADVFRTHPNFASLDLTGARREVPFRIDIAGMTINGTADLVCEDMVLDFKTGIAENPEHHYLQMWVYSVAFQKPRTYLAFLRTAELHEVSPAALEAAAAEAEALLQAISAGNYEPPPGHSCQFCSVSG